jgi:hypothetical protein
MAFFPEHTRLFRQMPEVAFVLRALANVGDHAKSGGVGRPGRAVLACFIFSAFTLSPADRIP